MSKIRSLEETVRSLLTEQKAVPEKLSIDIGGTPHDPTSPNAKHIEEDEQIDEIKGTSTPIGGVYNPLTTEKNKLGGNNFLQRASLQRHGMQSTQNRYENYDIMAEEATKKVLSKLKEKKEDQMTRGKTSTGQPSEPVDTKPVKPEIAGSY